MTKVIQQVVSSPLVKIIGIGAGIQKAVAPKGREGEAAEKAVEKTTPVVEEGE